MFTTPAAATALMPSSLPVMVRPLADCVSAADPQSDFRSTAAPDPVAAVVGMATLASSLSVTERSRPAPVDAVARAVMVVVKRPVQVHTPLPVDVSVHEPVAAATLA